MKDETVKSSINTALMYLAGSIHSAALCLTAFMLYYKLHVYLGLPQPSLDGLSVALVVFTFVFKKRIDRELEESGTSIQDALPKIATRTLYGVLALVLVFNMGTIIDFMRSFSNSLTEGLITK